MKTKSIGITLASAAAVIFTSLPPATSFADDVSSFSVEAPGNKNHCSGPNSCPGKTSTPTATQSTATINKKHQQRAYQARSQSHLDTETER